MSGSLNKERRQPQKEKEACVCTAHKEIRRGVLVCIAYRPATVNMHSVQL